MTLDAEVTKHVRGLPNAELWEMIGSPPGVYTEEAIRLARAEWDRRQIPVDEFDAIAQKAEGRMRESSIKGARDSRPLPKAWGAVCFVFACVGFIPIIIPLLYQRAGRWRAAEQAWTCFAFGIVTAIAILLASGFLKGLFFGK